MCDVIFDENLFVRALVDERILLYLWLLLLYDCFGFFLFSIYINVPFSANVKQKKKQNKKPIIGRVNVSWVCERRVWVKKNIYKKCNMYDSSQFFSMYVDIRSSMRFLISWSVITRLKETTISRCDRRLCSALSLLNKQKIESSQADLFFNLCKLLILNPWSIYWYIN